MGQEDNVKTQREPHFQTEEPQGLPASTRGQEGGADRNFLFTVLRRNHSSDTLTLGLQAPGPCCLSPSLWSFVRASDTESSDKADKQPQPWSTPVSLLPDTDHPAWGSEFGLVLQRAKAIWKRAYLEVLPESLCTTSDGTDGCLSHRNLRDDFLKGLASAPNPLLYQQKTSSFGCLHLAFWLLIRCAHLKSKKQNPCTPAL